MITIWLLVMLAPNGAVPLAAYPTEPACNRAMVQISYDAPVAPTIVCVKKFINNIKSI